MANHVLTTFAQRPPRTTYDRLAKVYADEVYPLYGARFADLAVAALRLPRRAQVLEIGCGAGDVTAELLHRIDGESRIVALEESPGLLQRARERLTQDHAGRRVFFRQHTHGGSLSFADETFDLVLSNLALPAADDPAATIADYARVTKPGGRVVLTTPLRGTWMEFTDLLRESLERLDRAQALEALAKYVERQPEGETVARWLEAAGLADVDEELVHWELLFRSGREFFYAPVIEQVELPRWKEIASTGGDMHEVFFVTKDAIDTYFAGHTFAVGVFGGCFSARKPG